MVDIKGCTIRDGWLQPLRRRARALRRIGSKGLSRRLDRAQRRIGSRGLRRTLATEVRRISNKELSRTLVRELRRIDDTELSSKLARELRRIDNKELSRTLAREVRRISNKELRRTLAGEVHATGSRSRCLFLTPLLSPGAYVCVVCGKRYRHQMSLTLHRKVHEGLTICPLCGTVSSKVHLRRHLENVHRLEQEQIYRLVPSRLSPLVAGSGADFVCTLCGQRYRSHRSLMSHTKLHQGLTVCHLCGKVSNNRPDLRKHLTMVHGLVSEDVQAYVPDGRRRGS
ncbi:zinc finger protein 616-like [Amphibalanus amphitrite]|uniref:zinc finger protein 616-like n=1 Tax=Amphibalanus amphitrite TaxID=1232801 RepID=UPI001C924621|nr:zinc finger protein 616-like [Amphibalanus amphitrite]